ncbi:pseudouridine synthase [Polycladidibacter hongkongensis]|uniref:pseudouridine synthase n=1 Tax=Polycladidibacter hongkongensis TaxID=1647556 RepID=UPI0009EB5DF8|nr:pseudouridine synthase [Pseudovibrio hongkongensis]
MTDNRKGAGAKPGARGGKPSRDDRPAFKNAPKRSAKKKAAKPEPIQQMSGERIAKAMARAGLCSRREAESWIEAGRVSVNGEVLTTPAFTVTDRDNVIVDGAPLPKRERTRLWLFHKSKGCVTTTKDPEGRTTVFDALPKEMPRVVSIGRLDYNTEGLLLFTNDGGLSRVIELPATGWLRRYRVRAYGKVTQEQLNALADGVAIDGVLYGAIEATLDSERGDNVWLTIGLREGKNREVKKITEHLGLSVNRLIRISFGPFQLGDLGEGEVREIRGRVLRDQLGEKLVAEADLDFDAPIIHQMPSEQPAQKKKERKSSGGSGGGWLSAKEASALIRGDKKTKTGAHERKREVGSDTERGQRQRTDNSEERRSAAPSRYGKNERGGSTGRGEGRSFGGERKQFGGEGRKFGKDRDGDGERRPDRAREDRREDRRNEPRSQRPDRRDDRRQEGRSEGREERRSFGGRDQGRDDRPRRFDDKKKPLRVRREDGSVELYYPKEEAPREKKISAPWEPEKRRFGTRVMRDNFGKSSRKSGSKSGGTTGGKRPAGRGKPGNKGD